MARVQITIDAGRYLDQVVRPFAEAAGAGTAFGVFRNAVIRSGPSDPVGVVPENQSVSFEIDLPQLPAATPGAAGPSLQPIDPKQVLEELSKAIRDARRVLGQEQMTLMSADVEVELTVAVGSVAGGQAKVRLHIGPDSMD
ncbi:MAG: hypothetical protein AB7H96_22050 [Vicinamibacterales bacterium]